MVVSSFSCRWLEVSKGKLSDMALRSLTRISQRQASKPPLHWPGPWTPGDKDRDSRVLVEASLYRPKRGSPLYVVRYLVGWPCTFQYLHKVPVSEIQKPWTPPLDLGLGSFRPVGGKSLVWLDISCNCICWISDTCVVQQKYLGVGGVIGVGCGVDVDRSTNLLCFLLTLLLHQIPPDYFLTNE